MQEEKSAKQEEELRDSSRVADQLARVESAAPDKKLNRVKAIFVRCQELITTRLIKIKNRVKSSFSVRDSVINADDQPSLYNKKGEVRLNNHQLLKRQKLLISAVLLLGVFIVISLLFLKNKQANEVVTNRAPAKEQSQEAEAGISRLELADSGLDTEKRWRDHLESIIEQQNRLVEERLKIIEARSEQMSGSAKELVSRDLAATRQQMEQARSQLAEAKASLDQLVAKELERQKQEGELQQIEVKEQALTKEIEFDQPKPVEHYIPEGTYFTGHLLGGIAVSTALNTADEHATPVIIRLQERGNLHKNNRLNIAQCRIMGSAYGDLSAERAVIRLEKLICERDGLYHTSKIAGQVFGPDGLNGVKGRIVDSSNKHVKNIILSGLISGLANSVKSGDAAVISSSGIAVTKQKNMGDYFSQGALAGAGNVGEKIANYFLRQAESMSPILTIDAGVKVNVQITRGFYFGEIGTHRQIKKLRQ